MIIPTVIGVAAAAAGRYGPSALSSIRSAGRVLVAAKGGGTLTGYTGIGRLEPVALIDESLRRNPEIVTPLAQLTQSIITAYFLRAVSLHNIVIGGVSIARHLEPYATSRSAATAVGLGLSHLANEDYQDRLVFNDEVRAYPKAAIESINGGANTFEDGTARYVRQTNGTFSRNRIVSLEALNSGGNRQGNNKASNPQYNPSSNRSMSVGSRVGVDPHFKPKKEDPKKESPPMTFEYRNVADITDAGSLVTGKLVNVTLKHGSETATVPVGVRLNCKWLHQDPMIAILGGAKDIRFGTRWAQAMNGEISWKDMATSQDLIDEHKRTLKADKSGVFLAMHQRRQGNAIAAAASGVPSMNNASSVYIVSAETAAQIELRAGGSFDNFQFRQTIFSHGYGMILAVVNMRLGSVSIYTRDIPDYTEVDFSSLKSGKDSADIGDILSAFRAGNSMRL